MGFPLNPLEVKLLAGKRKATELRDGSNVDWKVLFTVLGTVFVSVHYWQGAAKKHRSIARVVKS